MPLQTQLQDDKKEPYAASEKDKVLQEKTQ